MTTIRLTGGGLGSDEMRVRCDLTRAESPVQVDYCIPGEDHEWKPTQYQCGDTGHTTDGLADIGKSLAAQAVELPFDEFDCEVEEVE